MAPRIKPSPKLEALKGLAGEPERQRALALEIVGGEKDIRALRAALDVLKERPTPAARPALLERFEYLAADGAKRDTGGTLRAAILEALRRIAEPADLPLLERAASTYEFLPPGRSEETWLLRSTALVVMNELDTLHASYHAVRLLADAHTSRLSGEPALTAARVLVSQDNRWPLYYYALHQAQPPPVADVVAECLKSLAGLPAALIVPLAEKYQDSDDDMVLAGLIDLALEYGGAEFEIGLVRRVLAQTRSLAVYRYLVTRIISGHSPVHLPELARLAGRERERGRLLILEEALALGRPDPDVHAAQAAVREQLHGPSRSTRGRQ